MLLRIWAIVLRVLPFVASSHENDAITVSGKLAVSYKIKWWPYQEKVNVKSIHVDLLKGKPLNLINSTANTRITIRGFVAAMEGNSRPTITGVHASERFVTVYGSKDKVSRIELTPIVGVKTSSSYRSVDLPFEISFNYEVNTFRWGKNDIVFASGDQEELVALFQTK